MIFSFGKTDSKEAVIGRLEATSQTLLIAPDVIRHVRKHRQLAFWSKEAGGQLFGRIDTDTVHLVEATGPYKRDERSRHRYRSNAETAQAAIDVRSKRGLLYLGEWHTHAEDYPSASGLDDDAMCRIISNSRLNTNGLLMMIVGRSARAEGLAIWTVASEVQRQWTLSTLK